MKLPEKDIIYLCGFLDGDGSLVAQIVQSKAYKRGFYIRVCVNFHQKTNRHWFLLQLKRLLKVGSLSKKKNGMSLYTIVEKNAVKELLTLFKPYLRIKKSLARLILRIIDKCETVATDAEFIEVCELVDKTAELTDSKMRKHTSQSVKDFLNSRAQTKIRTEL